MPASLLFFSRRGWLALLLCLLMPPVTQAQEAKEAKKVKKVKENQEAKDLEEARVAKDLQIIKATKEAQEAKESQAVKEVYPVRKGRPAPPDLLAAGPMVGYSAMRAVGLWVQLTREGGAQVEYWVKRRPQRMWRTAIGTTMGSDHIVQLVADSVQPGEKYSYRVLIAENDDPRLREAVRSYPLEFQAQALWQWRTDPPDFRVALGSCNYVNQEAYDRPGPPYGEGFQIFKAIDQSRPDMMLWLGDNTYLREADWDSPLGIRRRYAHTRALPEMQSLLGSVHHYATWDDHDYGPNDSDRSFALKEESLATFKQYWMNPNYGLASGGVTGMFSWADVDFFLLDDRWNRTPNNDDAAHGQILGAAQLRWLTEALEASRATFKIVAMGGQILNEAQVFENYSRYQQERTELLRRLAETRVPGVVLVSGDRQHAEFNKLERPGLYPLYELTTSPLTAGPAWGGHKEKNPLRDSATYYGERNFALLDVTGPKNARRLKITLCDTEGQKIWSRELRADQLRAGATPLPPVVVAPPPAPAPVVVEAAPAKARLAMRTPIRRSAAAKRRPVRK